MKYENFNLIELIRAQVKGYTGNNNIFKTSNVKKSFDRLIIDSNA